MSFDYSDKVLAGVGVFVTNNKGQILLGKRKNSHGAGEWSLPGGHCEKGETSAQSAIRELKEETGMIAETVRPLCWRDHEFDEVDRQYVTLYFLAEKTTGDPVSMEPDKCEKWDWFDIDNLPRPIFEHLDTVAKNWKPLFKWHTFMSDENVDEHIRDLAARYLETK